MINREFESWCQYLRYLVDCFISIVEGIKINSSDLQLPWIGICWTETMDEVVDLASIEIVTLK